MTWDPETAARALALRISGEWAMGTVRAALREAHEAGVRDTLIEANQILCDGLSSERTLVAMRDMRDRVVKAAAYEAGVAVGRRSVKNHIETKSETKSRPYTEETA